MVAWRDPVGPAEARAEALEAWREHARSLGKHAIVLAASEVAMLGAERAGFQSTWIGGEPNFDLSRFHVKGRGGAKLRLAMNHIRGMGARVREIDPLRIDEDRRLLRDTELAWKGALSARENGSFLRTEPMENASIRRYFAVERDVDGRTRFESFLVCAPVSATGWYLQDLVRRPDAPRGATELVSVFALETLKREGFAHATTGPVALYDPDGARTNSASQGIAAACIKHFDRLYGFAGMKQFRSKFPASSVKSLYCLYWPKVLTPFAVWDIAAVLAQKASPSQPVGSPPSRASMR